MSKVDDAFRAPGSSDAPLSETPRGSPRRRVLTVVAAAAVVLMLLGLFLPATRTSREAARRMSCSNNLKQIALALLNYEQAYGKLPPAYIASAEGTPMHSWRVLILPFLEQQELYEKYRFDEPWNGPHNSQLENAIPTVYRCPSGSYKSNRSSAEETGNTYLTHYLAISDEQTPLSRERAMKTADITDGAGETLLVVEVDSECVPWMAPRDIDVAGFVRVLKGRDKQRRQHTGGLNSAMADGSVQFFSHKVDRAMIRRLSTASGGETAQNVE